MGFFTEDKPCTAITASINRLIPDKTVDEFEPEVQLPQILECIKIQRQEGAIEAARAIRKKLKYGSTNVQYRALILLELLVSNGGSALVPLYEDSKLLERLRLMTNDRSVSPKVRKRLVGMILQWRVEFGNDPAYSSLVGLGKHINVTNRNVSDLQTARRTVPEYMDDSADDISEDEFDRISVRRQEHRTRNELDSQYEIPGIDLKKAAPEINRIISDAINSSTILKNSLDSLDRKHGELSMDNDKCRINFEKCRQIRRKVLRYLQLVTEGEFLGLLISANEALVEALNKYTEYSKPSDDVSTIQSSAYSNYNDEYDDDESRYHNDFDETSVRNYEESDEDDDNNPFNDKHKV